MQEDNWNKEKSTYINKLLKIEDTISNIVSKVSFMSPDFRKNLSIFKDKAEKYRIKLEKNIFEIAIVGQENSGKSSLANSIISSYAFPSANKRCTFTTTELQYGSNKTVIEFHTLESFNELFKIMLKEIKYPEWQNKNFYSMTSNEFENYTNKLKEEDIATYNYHRANTFEDIKTIIRGKDTIKEYLNKDNLVIDGHINFEVKKYITDEYLSRTVRKIIIYSSELRDMKNAIMYDVPGFTSPTKIHKEQTEEKLKSADAIILVHNIADVPNISGPQLDVFNKTRDSDDILLKEKLFVFANKLDMVGSYKRMEDAIINLNQDIQKNDLAYNDRILYGSSGVYLARKDIQIDETNDPDLVEKLKNSEIQDGIDELRKKLNDYYTNQRFNILKRRVEKLIEDVRLLCQEFINSQEKEIINYSSGNNTFSMAIDSINIFKSNLVSFIEEIWNEITEETNKAQYLSEKFVKNIEEGGYFNKVDNNVYKKALSKIIKDGKVDTPDKVNDNIREDLYNKYKLDLENIILGIAEEKYKEYSNKILKAFLKSLEINENHLYYSNLEESTQIFLEELFRDIKYKRDSFIFLVERFSVDIMEMLILHRLDSQGRKNKFKEAKKTFYTLAIFYGELKDITNSHPLIKMLLTQEKEPKDKIRNQFENREISLKDRILSKKNDNELDYQVKSATNENEVLEEINKDIDNLKELLKTAIVSAIELEKPFKALINKQLNELRETAKSNMITSELKEFFINNLKYIKYDEYSKMESEEAIYQDKKVSVNSIKELLSKI